MTDFTGQIIAEFRANGGQVSTGGFGSSLVLLHTVGAKTGVERVTPVMAMKADDSWLIVASAAGAPQSPAWYFNLLSTPEVTIEAGSETVEVVATPLSGTEYDETWASIAAKAPGFESYKERVAGARTIPIVRLTRRGSTEA
jgi:deazaflavin-dependent oxidoreductase (nitroreductase family)